MSIHSASYLMHASAAKQWQQIGIQHHHGLTIPLFSLHSAQSCGIGEFVDLLPLIDWCAEINFDVIQLLPLNDTGLETSPYNAISAYALNPIHLGIAALPHLHRHLLLQEALKIIPKTPHGHRINYRQVREAKESFLRHYYQLVRNQVISGEAYQRFLQRTSTWLLGYALFKTLKSHFHWQSWETWPVDFRDPSSERFNQLLEEYKQEVEWHCFIQFLCDSQLQDVKKYAIERGVYLMGDIPILISRDSADVWLHRQLFNLNYSAGAPPDMFTKEGQNWMFPIYNWEEIAKQDYQWWKDRLNCASQYYQIYRIDHIVGFFRIWAIPPKKTGKHGHFVPPDHNLWIDHGQRIMLMMLENCSMLPIGEDLGDVPVEVRTCLSALGICGTKVVRWERKWEEKEAPLIPLDQYPIASMTTVSTHDTETLQIWWHDHPKEAKAFAYFKGWGYHPILSREYHHEILWDSHHSSSLFHINLLQEYLALVPGFTWPNPEEERINIPGTLSENNWSYRFRPSVEEITNDSTLTHILQEMIF